MKESNLGGREDRWCSNAKRKKKMGKEWHRLAVKGFSNFQQKICRILNSVDVKEQKF